MSTMIWDEVGTRYYETGVSKGIFFPMPKRYSDPIDGGVPWNGLVAVNLDPSGGGLESYYFDGKKYMDRMLAEDFQATVQAITTPKEFEPCEGVVEVKYGMKTHFNQRAKFNMAWRTEIGNDQDQDVAYKWHIAYNCIVQPSARAYQTISDTVSPDIRSFVITTTPACGRDSYFTFDSRDGDLSALEAQLMTGVLPKCWELSTLVGGTGGGGDSGDPDAGCPTFLIDFESYIHGSAVSDSVIDGDNEANIFGVINNGLDIIELPAVGAFAANDSAASEVGTGDILADDDDATYITSADGDLGYTVGLPPLVGYVDGAALELHIRMSISGGVNPDDPDNLDADAQVHISTDAGGDDTIGGFSDGTDEGMGFALSVVDGTPVDYVVPLSMDAWVDSTVDDVVTALEAGSYLNVVGATNNNTDTTPEVRVYEAKIVMLNDTDGGKFLRPADSSSSCQVHQHIYSTGTTDLEASLTDYVDFRVIEIPNLSSYASSVQSIGTDGFSVGIEMVSGVLKVRVYDDSSSTPLGTYEPVLAKWYRLRCDWSWTTVRVQLFDVDDLTTPLLDTTWTTTVTPVANSLTQGGSIGDGTRSFEVDIDNAKIQIHCNDIKPPAEWIDLDLSTAVFYTGTGTGGTGTWIAGHYDSGTGHIQSGTDSDGFPLDAQFHFPSLTLDPTKSYQFVATYAAPTYGFGIMQENPDWETTFYSDNYELYYTFAHLAEYTANIGPGIDEWNAWVAAPYSSQEVRFDASTNTADLIGLKYKEV